MTRRATPRSIGSALREVRERVEPATPLAAAQGAWASAVGDRIAAQAWPARERDGTLTVSCATAAWAQELDLLQDELLERLNGQLGDAPVQRLRFVVGDDRP